MTPDLYEPMIYYTPFLICFNYSKYANSELQDFVTFTENSVKGRPAKEYALTLDMAKELSMVERNDKGRYFHHW